MNNKGDKTAISRESTSFYSDMFRLPEHRHSERFHRRMGGVKHNCEKVERRLNGIANVLIG